MHSSLALPVTRESVIPRTAPLALAAPVQKMLMYAGAGVE
jgi:hypothetical protein